MHERDEQGLHLLPAEVATLRELLDLLGDRWMKADDYHAAKALVKKITDGNVEAYYDV